MSRKSGGGPKGAQEVAGFPKHLSKKSLSVCNELMNACLKSKVSISNASEVFSNLHSLTQLLIDLQRNFCYLRQLESRSSEREASIKNYLTAHSSYLHKEVSVRDFSTCGFGLSALVPLTEGECVLRVPKSAMLTSEAPEKLQLMMKDDPIFASMDNVALSLRLLYELSNFHTSSWREYLSILPVTYSTFMYMSVDDFKHLKGSKTAETLASNYQFICRQYAYFFNRFRSFSPSKEIPLSARFCFEDYRWAVSTVMSRNNIIPVKESLSKQICLVPIWDMINHKPGAVTTDYDINNQELVFYAMEDVASGNQVLMDYGKRTSGEFLIFSGFVPDPNPHNLVDVTLSISKADRLGAKRQTLLGHIGLENPTTSQISADLSTMRDLVAFARVFVMVEDQLDEYLTLDEKKPGTASETLFSSICPLRAIDRSAISFLTKRFELLILCYGTVPARDSPDFAKMSFLQQQCTLLRLQDLEMLRECIASLKTTLSVPGVTEDELMTADALNVSEELKDYRPSTDS